MSEFKNRSENGIYSSILDGEIWQSIEKRYHGKIVLPLLLYFDDFEINNPLGSHSNIQKIGAVYYTIPCMPRKYGSILENIFLAQLHRTQSMKHLGTKIIFQNIINEFSHIEKEGITISLFGEKKQIYFVLTAIIGDNLGLNEILGFTTSFNSDYCCRICTVDKTNRCTQLQEDTTIIRNRRNYASHVEDCSYGVSDECIFNSLMNFHVTENITLDYMHDVLEGICRYELRDILNELINVQKLFSLETLNCRIKFFDIGSKSGVNKPPLIPESLFHKKFLILSASEMLCLVRFLGLIIGDLVPLNNRAWKLWVLLREIICLILSPVISKETCILLQNIIREHHELYLKLFSDKLKPKHHFLLHYPNVIRKYGPVKYISSFRFEAKHKNFKNGCCMVTSRKNPPHTISLNHQLQLNYRFLLNEGFSDRLHIGTSCELEICRNTDYYFFKDKLPDNIGTACKFVQWISIFGTKHKVGMAVVIDTDDIVLTFGKIKYIMVTERHKIYFVIVQMHTKSFITHYHAYEVVETSVWQVVAQEHLTDYSPYNLHIQSDEKVLIACI
ncbi:uncharacterized protein [Prorops nasuta]|uniref:uncharacterized protein n=1 Tax=Prorops nasuta TaxID=863751 RepID=UPI0034CD39DA